MTWEDFIFGPKPTGNVRPLGDVLDDMLASDGLAFDPIGLKIFFYVIIFVALLILGCWLFSLVTPTSLPRPKRTTWRQNLGQANSYQQSYQQNYQQSYQQANTQSRPHWVNGNFILYSPWGNPINISAMFRNFFSGGGSTQTGTTAGSTGGTGYQWNPNWGGSGFSPGPGTGTSTGNRTNKQKIKQNRPTTLYHGAPDMQIVNDIVNNGVFRVGPSIPYGMWLSPHFHFSAGYTRQKGAVIEFYVPLRIPLATPKPEQYVYETPNNNPGDHVRFKKIKVMGVWNPDGTRIQ